MGRDLFTVLAAAAVFIIMFTLGLGIALPELRWLGRRTGLLARALFAVLVAVPAVAVAVEQALDLPRSAGLGIVLMAIAPGAPVALRRSLDAGGHQTFAPSLQVLLALLAVVSMPLSLAALVWLYDGHASLAPGAVARQVLLAQLLPLGAGALLRRQAPALAARLEPPAARASVLLLIGLTVAILLLRWRVVVEAGPVAVAAMAFITGGALAIGHVLGGPDPDTRTAVAISSAARNPGLALLVATLNQAPPEVGRVVLAYVVVSAVVVLPYAAWRRRVRPAPGA